jgi:spermidine/putrescine-binding protein
LRRITRREALRGMGAAAALGALAACSVRPKRTGAAPTLSPLPAKAGKLVMATWPLYIDVDEKTGKRPTIEQFQKETGISVDYKEAIPDNDPFYGTIRESLARGRPTGWDMIIVTDWLVGRMIRNGYLEPLHMDRLPTVAENIGAGYRNPPGDPGSLHSVPWQAGVTGIAYNTRLIKREINSFQDLFDPAFKGKVGMLSDMRDMIHVMLLLKGVEPGAAETEDVRKAVDALIAQRKAGIVRDYYENDYTDALARGDLALCLAYSGDVFQLQADNPHLRFVVPKEGGILFVDAMVIPKGAEHPTDAHAFMDFVYRPEIAAQIAEYVQFITPVPKAKPVVLSHAAAATGEDREALEALAASQLVFPDEATQRRLRRYRNLTDEEERTWNQMFSEVVQG